MNPSIRRCLAAAALGSLLLLASACGMPAPAKQSPPIRFPVGDPEPPPRS